MSKKGLVLDIDRFSTHDGPGIRTAVFLKGCQLACKWCHSPESQSAVLELFYQRMRCTGCGSCVQACPHGAITHDGEIIEGVTGVNVHRDKCVRCFACVQACHFGAMRIGGTFYTASELVESIKPDLPFFDNSGGGVTITGGEPLMQADFTAAVLQGCRELGMHTALETCGYGNTDKLMQIADLCCMIFFDIKLLDQNEHEKWTGVSNRVILSNLKHLCASPATAAKIIVRVPCIPGVNDRAEHIQSIAMFVKTLGIPSIQLEPYNPMAGEKYGWTGDAYYFAGTQPREKSYYEELNRIIEATGIQAIR